MTPRDFYREHGPIRRTVKTTDGSSPFTLCNVNEDRYLLAFSSTTNPLANIQPDVGDNTFINTQSQTWGLERWLSHTEHGALVSMRWVITNAFMGVAIAVYEGIWTPRKSILLPSTLKGK